MLLVQQPQHPPSSSLMPPHKQYSSSFHRRNPSAPAAVVQVQPTKTPGLLALSKPAHIRPHANPQSVRHPTPRQPKARHPLPQVQPAQQQQVQSPESSNSSKRGRGSPGKDIKAARNSSKSRAGHGGRARQPSPSPISFPEQASNDEAPTPKPIPATLPKASSPAALVSTPTGRLAKRRNRGPIPFPQSNSTLNSAAPSPATAPNAKSAPGPVPTSVPKAKAKSTPVPVPVPTGRKEARELPLSRSDPVTTHFIRSPIVFPICDDTDSDGERPSTPSPTRANSVTWQQTSLYDSEPMNTGPRTAPLASQAVEAKHYFPSPAPSPSPVSRLANHKRTPSMPVDALYNLAFESDSEVNVSLGEISLDTLFGRSVRRPRLPSNIRPMSTPNGKSTPVNVNANANMIGGISGYASSMFQNSPSPEQLPPPPSFTLVKSDGSTSD